MQKPPTICRLLITIVLILVVVAASSPSFAEKTIYSVSGVFNAYDDPSGGIPYYLWIDGASFIFTVSVDDSQSWLFKEIDEARLVIKGSPFGVADGEYNAHTASGSYTNPSLLLFVSGFGEPSSSLSFDVAFCLKDTSCSEDNGELVVVPGLTLDGGDGDYDEYGPDEVGAYYSQYLSGGIIEIIEGSSSAFKVSSPTEDSLSILDWYHLLGVGVEIVAHMAGAVPGVITSIIAIPPGLQDFIDKYGFATGRTPESAKLGSGKSTGPLFTLRVTDPGGWSVSATEEEIPGAFLVQTDFAAFDSQLEVAVIIDPEQGVYEIGVERGAGAVDTDTFFLARTEKLGDFALSELLAEEESVAAGGTWSTTEVPPSILFADAFETGNPDAWSGAVPDYLSTEERCENSGGVVEQMECCGNEFANTCNIGACGCAPDPTSTVWGCVCPSGSCFDGTSCVVY